MKRLILASQSVRRRAALEQLGAKFEVVPSDYEEDMTLDMPVTELVEHLALGKAMDVAEKHPEAVVIGCDSLIVTDETFYPKPKDMAEAHQQMRTLQGTRHDFVSGYAIVHKAEDHQVTGHTVSGKVLVPMNDEEIDAYLSEGEPLGKAGSYSAEGKGIAIIAESIGPADMGGFPTAQIVQELKSFGINLLTEQY